MMGLIGLISDGIAIFRDKQKAAANAEIRQIESADASQLAQIKASGKFLRMVSYSMFGLPMVISVIAPEHGQKIWQNLDTVPEWYLQAFIMINGAVWGIAELRKPLAAIAGRMTAGRAK